MEYTTEVETKFNNGKTDRNSMYDTNKQQQMTDASWLHAMNRKIITRIAGQCTIKKEAKERMKKKRKMLNHDYARTPKSNWVCYER